MKGIKTLKPHIAINVRDVQRSVDFYRRMFGVEPVRVRADYAKFDLENPPLNFALNQRLNVTDGALSHLGIQVASTEDVLKVRERWKEIGIPTRDEMRTVCCYALQDKVWVTDPDGNRWEVFVVLDGKGPEEAEATECCA